MTTQTLAIIQDTLDFTVSADKTVVNDTVKIMVHVTALVGVGVAEPKAEDESPTTMVEAIKRDSEIVSRLGTGDDGLRAEIRTVLRRFIDTPEWQFSNMQRSSDPTGVERLSLIATARVPERENYSLEDRASAVSRKGLKLHDPVADTSIPAKMIEEAERDLRAMILAKVMEEAKSLSDASKRNYRVAKLSFGSGPRFSASNSMVGATRAMAAAAPMAGAKAAGVYGSGFDEDDNLGNAQKLEMSASVTLATLAFPDAK